MEGYPSMQLIGDIEGKNCILRVDFNVPIQNGVIVDDFRIKQSLKTIEFLRKKRAKVIIVSHIENEERASLKPVADYLQKKMPVHFIVSDNLSDIKAGVDASSSDELIILENIRRFSEEKENVPEFSMHLSKLGHLYVNEAFSVSHRRHASIVGVPSFLPAYFGFNFMKEVENLSSAFHPDRPFLFILGGAKFQTKAPLIKKFLEKSDDVFVGGALANDFIKEKGLNVGRSLTSEELPSKEIIDNKKIIFPIDVVVHKSDGERKTVLINEIEDGDIVSDIGDRTIEMLRRYIGKASMILWNGPLGFYEYGFDFGTKEVAKAVSKNEGRTIVGGGDTVALIQKMKIEDDFTFVSTAGGAMLDFLSNETLPGIEAILNKTK